MFNQINWHDVIAFAKKHDRAILAVVTGGAAIAAAWCSAVETSQMSDDIKDVLANPEATIVDKGKAVAESHKMTLVALGIALTSAVFGYKCGAEAIAGISAVAAGALAEGVRQERFDNWELTDDHGMHIFGVAKDQNGKEYYMVQNSWGETGDYKGIWYMTKAFIAANTMDFLINKNAIPAEIRKKLGL